MERADSWATDAHKWLNVPYDCGIVICRDADGAPRRDDRARRLPGAGGRGAPHDPFDWVPEFSRRGRGIPVYAAIARARTRGRRGARRALLRWRARSRTGCGASPTVEILNDVVLNQVLVRVRATATTTRDAAVVAACSAKAPAGSVARVWHGDRRDAHLGVELDHDRGRHRSSVDAILKCQRECEHAAFFVHGVPDTSALWDSVRANIERDDVIAPNLPGFGAPVPAGFGATKEEYVDWVIAEIEKVGEPVDIVGHDWGSIIVQRVVSLRPEFIRTWAAGGGTVDREYVWHELAQMWQTPDVGEQVMEAMIGDALVDTLAEQVGGHDKAVALAAHIDDTMKDCILKLYRSAAAGFGGVARRRRQEPLDAPGVVFWGADDPYVTPNFGERLAERTNTTLVMFPSSGHWWPATEPAEVGSRLDELWTVGG